jgi:hypothetical protein
MRWQYIECRDGYQWLRETRLEVFVERADGGTMFRVRRRKEQGGTHKDFPETSEVAGVLEWLMFAFE